MKRFVAWALGLGVSMHAASAGFTDEQWALISRLLGNAHLAVSADEQWRLRTQELQLLREPVRPAQSGAVSLPLGEPVLALAASRDTQRAVVQTEHCIGLARFDVAGGPRITWFSEPSPSTQSPPPESCPVLDHGSNSFAVAMSPDGRRAAVPMQNEVRLIDVEQGRVLQRWPLGRATVLQLAFLDEGKELLVRAAVLGEAYEGPGIPSHLMLARWDIQRGVLLDFWIERDRRSIGPLTLVSAMSADLGWLWQVEEESNEPDAPAKLFARSMRECGMPRKASVTLPGPRAHWLDLTADPRGRWLAFNDYEPSDHAGWRIVSAVDGQPLDGEMRRGPKDAAVRALQPSADGSRLRGVVAGLPEGGRVDAEMWTVFRGGGALFERRVPGLQPAAAVAPARAPGCVISAEGERTTAVREVKDTAAPGQRVFDLALETPAAAQARQERFAQCPAEAGTPPLWGVDRDGALWLDAGAQLQRLDAATGRVLPACPRRAARRCAAHRSSALANF